MGSILLFKVDMNLSLTTRVLKMKAEENDAQCRFRPEDDLEFKTGGRR